MVNAARVSFAKKKEHFGDDDAKLLRYLVKHNHWTPFSHPQLQFHMKVPIFVARQLFKHKVGLTENEISRRYVDSEPEFYLPKTWRARAKDKKQGSGQNIENIAEIDFHVRLVVDSALISYKRLLAQGVPGAGSDDLATEYVYRVLLDGFAGGFHASGAFEGCGRCAG